MRVQLPGPLRTESTDTKKHHQPAMPGNKPGSISRGHRLFYVTHMLSRVTMAPRSAHRVPNETMKEADGSFHVGAGGGEEEPLRQECAWIGRGTFSNGGGKKNPPNVQLELHFYKMSPDKQSHSCSVPTERLEVSGDLIVPWFFVTILVSFYRLKYPAGAPKPFCLGVGRSFLTDHKKDAT